MTRAYHELFLDDAMDTLGSAVEYAVLTCGMDGQEFLNLFVVCGIADAFGMGGVAYISGMSGIELARKTLERTGKGGVPSGGDIVDGYSPEYWVGWILAYYQWYSGKPFRQLFRYLKYQTVRTLYGALHEADPSKAAAVFDQMA